MKPLYAGILLAASLLGAEIPVAWGPHDAVAAAALNAGSLGPVEAPHYRYFWAIDSAEEFHDAFSYALNTAISHSPNLYQPERLAEGRLIRVDLRRLAPQVSDYARLVSVLETLAGTDPYFHTQGKRKVAPYKASDGKTYDFVVGSDVALHSGPDKHLLLTTLTGSAAPILRADWMLVKMLSVLDGGLYYKLRGFDAKPASGTQEEAFHSSLGADPKQAAALRSDERLVTWHSNVTGKPRAIEFFYAANVRPSLGPSLLTITRDYFDGQIDGQRHAVKNLLNYQFDGSEQIGMLPNAMLAFALFDNKGNLVDVAPQNLVTDRTVPSPHTANLQAGISCIRCHAADEGWKKAQNDLKLLTSGPFAIDIFDDESSKDDPVDTLDRLVGLYSGDIEEPLRLARTTHAKAVFKLTGQEPTPVMEYVGRAYNAYAYDSITPAVACREAGYQVNDDSAVAVFNRICPKLPPNAAGVSPESITIASLRAWTKEKPIRIPRGDFEQEFADFALRVRTTANLEAAK